MERVATSKWETLPAGTDTMHNFDVKIMLFNRQVGEQANSGTVEKEGILRSIELSTTQIEEIRGL